MPVRHSRTNTPARKPALRLLNARAMNKAHPDTFWVPEIDDILALRVGETAKIAAANERFWVTITGFAGEGETRRFTGTVANFLIGTDRHGLECGDPVRFGVHHILSFYTEAELAAMRTSLEAANAE